jgi:hypothetical protein
LALFTGRKATSNPLPRVRDAQRGQPSLVVPTGLGHPLQAIRQSNAGHHPNAKLSRAAAELVEKPVPNVVDDLPEILPVLQRELDIIETYLGATLDQLLSELE